MPSREEIFQSWRQALTPEEQAREAYLQMDPRTLGQEGLYNTPVIGDLLSLAAAVFGREPITGEKLNWLQQGAHGFFALPFISGQVIPKSLQNELLGVFLKMGRTPRGAKRILGRNINPIETDFVPTKGKAQRVTIEQALKRAQRPGTWLEPSAGEGHLLDELVAQGVPKEAIQAIELDPIRAATLRSKGYRVHEGDFLDFSAPAENIVMNPPFSSGQYWLHLAKGYSLLKPGGQITAILPAQSVHGFGSALPAKKAFQQWVLDQGGEFSPWLSFKSQKGKPVVGTAVTIPKK